MEDKIAIQNSLLRVVDYGSSGAMRSFDTSWGFNLDGFELKPRCLRVFRQQRLCCCLWSSSARMQSVGDMLREVIASFPKAVYVGFVNT